MLERDVVKAVLKTLRSRGALAEKMHGDMYQPAVVDIIACYRGIYVALECKADERKKATPRQKDYLRRVRNAGGVSACIYSDDQASMILDWIDRRLDSGKTVQRARD